jgi:tripartite-type tricarboxylate transporter receptor subunit TctC
LAPAGTPAAIIAKFNSSNNTGLKSPKLKSDLALGSTPEDFAELIKTDFAKWEPILKSLNLKPQ